MLKWSNGRWTGPTVTRARKAFNQPRADFRSGGTWRAANTPMALGSTVTNNSALSIGTFFDCIRNKAEDIAKLPFKILRTERKENGLEVRVNVSTEFPYLAKLWSQQFNPYCSAMQGKKTLLMHVFGWGNALAKREYNSLKQVVEYWIIHPSRVVRMFQRDDLDGLYYEIRNNDGTTTILSWKQVFHFYVESPNGLWGYSTIDLMRRDLGLATVAQEFITKFYENCARPTGILQTDDTLSKQAREQLKREWQEAYGGAPNAGKTAVIDGGMTYIGQSMMSLADQQFLELLMMSDERIARKLRMPLYKIQIVKAAQGWSTLDAQETDYANSCLLPITVDLEQVIKIQEMPDTADDPDVWPHFEFKALLLGDVTTRMKFAQYLFNIGVPPNRILTEIEDMRPEENPAMDKSYIQSNMTPIEKAGEAPTGSAAPAMPSSPRGVIEILNGKH